MKGEGAEDSGSSDTTLTLPQTYAHPLGQTSAGIKAFPRAKCSPVG